MADYCQDVETIEVHCKQAVGNVNTKKTEGGIESRKDE